MRHIYNFSAGPAVLPEPVLQEAADEMMNYKGSGMSVMEISHRSALFQSIIDEAEHDLRTLMHIPDDYEVLFLQGGDFPPIRYDPDELYAQSKGRLYSYGALGKESQRGGVDLREGPCGGIFGG